MFLKKTLSHIFPLKIDHVYWQCKNIQNRVPESGHATIKYFTKIVEFKRFPKQALSYTFVF